MQTSSINLEYIKHPSFITLFFTFVILFFVGYCLVFEKQIGCYLKHKSPWKVIYQIKNTLASKIQGKKIIIASGSNCLFGIDSKLLEEITGYKVANLACHAGLDLGLLYLQIKEIIKPGDIVVMPLEAPYYTREKLTDFYVDNVIEWAWQDCFSCSSIIDKINFMISVPPERILSGLFKAKCEEQDKVSADVEEVINFKKNNRYSEWHGYNYKSLNSHGDILVDEPPTKKVMKIYKQGTTYFSNVNNISDHFIYNYNKIKKMVSKSSGRLILTWPVTIRNKKLDLKRDSCREELRRFKIQLSKYSIPIFFNPALFNLDINCFFNTRSHTNWIGARIRTENLGACIVNLLKEHNRKTIGYDQAIQIVRDKEKDLLGYSAIKDLKKIKRALEMYFNDKKHYPVSTGFDGIHTKWGKSGKDWIPELVPDYIDSLPRKQPYTNSNSTQYLYKSDGKDYKLISHCPKDCQKVKEVSPNLIDPRRDCWAYGFWTPGAKEW